MKIIVANTIRIEDPSPQVLAWCKEFLTIPNPEYAKKARMNLWLGSTPRTLSLYETHGNSLILPLGTLRNLRGLIKGSEIISNFKSPQIVPYPGEIPLYDYQEAAVADCISNRYGILQSPAGSGKTQMGIAIIMRYKRKALWLTHTQDLLRQSRERAERYMDKNLIGTITEGKVNIGSGVTFATIQTMCRLDLVQYRDVWDVIVVDECHRVAGTPTSMTQFYKVLNALSARHKYGLSATVHRADGMISATYALLGEVIHTVPDRAVADKIMRVGIRPVATDVGISRQCLNTDGTLNYSRLITYLCEQEARNALIAQCIALEGKHPCLILSDRLEHLESLMNSLPPDLRKDSTMVSGKMTSKKAKEDREHAIEDMRSGRKRFLFATYSLAKEGLDIPRLERLFLTTPQKDYAVVTQSIGRIARTCDKKQPPIAYDFVDAIGYLQKSYKARCRTYRKNGCYFIAEQEGQ